MTSLRESKNWKIEKYLVIFLFWPLKTLHKSWPLLCWKHQQSICNISKITLAGFLRNQAVAVLCKAGEMHAVKAWDYSDSCWCLNPISWAITRELWFCSNSPFAMRESMHNRSELTTLRPAFTSFKRHRYQIFIYRNNEFFHLCAMVFSCPGHLI